MALNRGLIRSIEISLMGTICEYNFRKICYLVQMLLKNKQTDLHLRFGTITSFIRQLLELN